MAIVRWNPSAPRDLLGFQEEVNRMLDSFVGRPARNLSEGFAPPTEIEETPEEFLVKLDLPGISQKDVKVSLMGDTLTVRGERKLENTQKNGNVHHSERLYGSFERTFRLGAPVRNDGVTASYRDGVLEIHVPKAEEARMREIEVKVG
jgi:HSP20 family protein